MPIWVDIGSCKTIKANVEKIVEGMFSKSRRQYIDSLNAFIKALIENNIAPLDSLVLEEWGRDTIKVCNYPNEESPISVSAAIDVFRESPNAFTNSVKTYLKKAEHIEVDKWLEFKCPICNNPAVPVTGSTYWCPNCGWRNRITKERVY